MSKNIARKVLILQSIMNKAMKVIVSQEIERVCPEFVGACVEARVVNTQYNESR